MKNKIILIIVFFSVQFYPLLSQIQGFVESEGIPLQAATIILYSKDTSKIKLFTTTDSLGKWELLPEESATFILKVSHLGYESSYERIEYFREKPIHLNIQLEKSKYLLPEVAIKEKRLSVVIKGDTINYNVKAFDDLKPRNLGEVLNDLPGIEVTEDDKVIYKGKPIKTILIDGHDIVKDKSQALDGIHSDDIKNIQIIENYKNPDNPFNLNKSDEVALNVQTDTTSRWSRQLSIAGGLPADYVTNVDMYRSSSNSATTIFIRSHSIPKPILSSYEYLAVQSDITPALKRGSIQSIIPDELNIQEQTNKNIDHGMAINSAGKLNEKFRYNISINTGRNSRQSSYQSIISSLSDGNTQVVNTTDTITNSYLLTNMKVNYEFTPKSNIILIIPFTILKSNNRLFNNTEDQNEGIRTNEIKEKLEKNIGPKVTYNHKLNEDINFQIKFQKIYKADENKIQLNSSEQLFGQSMIQSINDLFPLQQDQSYFDNSTYTKTKVNMRIAKNSFINLSYIGHYTNQNIETISATLNLDESFKSKDELRTDYNIIESEYKYETNLSTLSIRFQTNSVKYSGALNFDRRLYVLPYFNLKTKVFKNYEISIQASQKIETIELNNISEIQRIGSSYVINSGNLNLNPVNRSTLFGILINKIDKVNLGNFFNLLLRYKIQDKGVQPNLSIKDNYQVWSYSNVFNIKNFETLLLLTRDLTPKFKFSLDTRFNAISQNLTSQNGNTQRLKLLNINVKGSYKIMDGFHIWLGTTLQYSKNKSTNTEIGSSSFIPTSGLRYASDKLGVLEIQLSRNIASNSFNSVATNNLSFEYEQDITNMISLFLQGQDLLQWNNRQGINVISTQNFVTIDSYNINQSYILMGIKYKI